MSRQVIDMMGRAITISDAPMRIISVVPSQTELLFDLGLDEEVVGITKFCVHPEEWFRTKQRIGGTKQLNIEKIKDLSPTLIIANKEENTKEQIEELALQFPVWISDITTVDDALGMIIQIGVLVNKAEEANILVAQIQEGFASIPKAKGYKKVAYFIWYNPWMAAGDDTFIDDVIERIGWKSILNNKLRYPEIDVEEMQRLQPELVLLSSEPFPFKDKHAEMIKNILPNAEIKLVDGEMFSWYGSRMLKAIPYFTSLVK